MATMSRAPVDLTTFAAKVKADPRIANSFTQNGKFTLPGGYMKYVLIGGAALALYWFFLKK